MLKLAPTGFEETSADQERQVGTAPAMAGLAREKRTGSAALLADEY
jgi:hypothetical protein